MPASKQRGVRSMNKKKKEKEESKNHEKERKRQQEQGENEQAAWERKGRRASSMRERAGTTTICIPRRARW